MLEEFKKRLKFSINDQNKNNKAKLDFSKCGLNDQTVRQTSLHLLLDSNNFGNVMLYNSDGQNILLPSQHNSHVPISKQLSPLIEILAVRPVIAKLNLSGNYVSDKVNRP